MITSAQPLDKSSTWPLAIAFGAIAGVVSTVFTSVYFGIDSVGLLGGLLVIFGILLLAPVVIDLRRHCFDPLEVRNLFMWVFAVYACSLPLLTFLQGNSVSEIASTSAIAKAFAITVFSTIFFFLGFRSTIGARVSSRLPLIGQVSVQRLRSATIAIAIIVLLWFCAFLFSIGGLTSFLGTGYTDIYELDLGKEYLGFSLNVLPACVLLLFHLANRTKSRAHVILAGTAFAGLLLLLLSGSRRRLLTTLLLSLLIYFHYAVRRVSNKALVAVAVLAALALSALGLLRAIPPQELASRRTMGFLFDQSPSQLFYGFLETGEPAGDFETFPFLIEEISNGMPLALGRTYFEAPIILLPRAVFPNRPSTPSQWFTEKFFPDVAKDLGGRPLFFLGEAYWNFGILGPPALMLLLGIGFSILHTYVRADGFNSESALIYAALLGTIPSAIRIDFATILKASICSTLPIILFVVYYAGGFRPIGRGLFQKQFGLRPKSRRTESLNESRC